MGHILYLRKGTNHSFNGLPSGYTRLEYIESNSDAYVDTGVYPATNTKMELDIAMLDGLTSKNLNGVRNKSGDATNRFGMIVYTSQQQWGGWYGTSTISGSTCDNNRHQFSIGPDGYYEDGTLIGIITENTFTCSYTLPLLAWSNGVDGVVAIDGRLWGCKLYDNGTLIRNFIPVMNDSGVAGLWDLVEKKFYGSATSTAFISGNII